MKESIETFIDAENCGMDQTKRFTVILKIYPAKMRIPSDAHISPRKLHGTQG